MSSQCGAANALKVEAIRSACSRPLHPPVLASWIHITSPIHWSHRYYFTVQVKLWNVETKECVMAFKGHNAEASVRFASSLEQAYLSVLLVDRLELRFDSFHHVLRQVS